MELKLSYMKSKSPFWTNLRLGMFAKQYLEANDVVLSLCCDDYNGFYYAQILCKHGIGWVYIDSLRSCDGD